MAARRPELVRAVLTILRAHALAGWPGGEWAPLGSFEEWDRTVRGAAWFATGLDCCRTRRQAADDSPERLARVALLEGWRELPTGGTERGMTAGEALEFLAAEENATACQTLRSVLRDLPRDGKAITSRQLGDLFRSIQNANYGGYILRNAGDFRRAVKWRVELAEGFTPPDPSAPEPGGEGCESTSQCESLQPKHKLRNGHAKNGAHLGVGAGMTHTDSPTHTLDDDDPVPF